MKTLKNLFSIILNKDYIRSIILLASRGKKSRRVVQKILSNIEFYVSDIYEMLKNKTYYMLPSYNKTIHDRGKDRDLTISPFYPNRILDYLMTETLKPHIRSSMYTYCIGNVDKRGISYGYKVIKRNYSKYKYYIKLDIHHFYPSLKSETLLDYVHKKVRDKDFLDLCDCVISSSPNLPIGSYYSQWFSNWFLQDMDYMIKQKYGIPFYVRYVDDMLLMSNNKQELIDAMYGVSGWLNERGLELKRFEQVYTVEQRPIDFLGFRFCDGKINLRTSVFKSMNKRIKNVRQKENVTQHDTRSLLSYIGWIKQIPSGFNYYEKKIKPIAKIGKLRAVASDTYSKKEEKYDKRTNCDKQL